MSDALTTVPVALILVAIIIAATAVLGKIYTKVKQNHRNTANLRKRRKLRGV